MSAYSIASSQKFYQEERRGVVVMESSSSRKRVSDGADVFVMEPESSDAERDFRPFPLLPSERAAEQRLKGSGIWQAEGRIVQCRDVCERVTKLVRKVVFYLSLFGVLSHCCHPGA